MNSCPRSPERWANTQRCSTSGCKACATSTALVAMKPSTTTTRRSSAACSTAPTMVAISKPPNAANASIGALASRCLCNTSRSTSVLRSTAGASSPVPAPVHTAMSSPASRDSSKDAAEVLPMPISPSSSALPGSPLTRSMPCCSACWHCTGVMAAWADESAVPCSAPAALRTCKPGRSGLAPSWPAGSPAKKSCLTPQSTTVSAMPFCRASTLTAAPPARKFSTICQVTSLGNAEMPRAVRP